MENEKKLRAIVQKGGPREKLKAVFELAKLGNFSKIDILIQSLKNKDWEIKTDAINFLGRIGWYPAINAIGEIIDKHNMYEINNVAIYALQNIGFPEGVAFLIEAIRDERFEVRNDARTALYRLFGDVMEDLIDPDDEEFIEEEDERDQKTNREALEISIWWSNNERKFKPNKAYFFGELSTPDKIFQKFKEEPELNDAYLDQLEDVTGQNFGNPSDKMIELWEGWLTRNNDKFIEGERYFFGHKL